MSFSVIRKSGVLLLAGLFAGYQASAQGKATPVALKDRQVTISLRNVPFASIVRELIVRHDVPIGFEEAVEDRIHDDFLFEYNLPCRRPCFDSEGNLIIDPNEPPRPFWMIKTRLMSVEVTEAPLSTVLDGIVAQLGNYKWEISDDVVNITPTTGRDKRFAALLDLRIRKFTNTVTGKPSRSINHFESSVMLLPEVVDFYEANRFQWSSGGYSSYYRSRDLDETPEFCDLTLRQLLNRLTALKRGGWILHINKKIKETEMGDWVKINI